MTLLAPLFALAGLAALPIILLYLLKMKRQERVISSTLLWRQTIKDLEANVPFQKLRANLLLILQILILALLVFALMRPTLPSSYRLSDRSVLVMDTSASMLAADQDEGSRFERARKLARHLIDSLERGQRMMILARGRMVTDGFVQDKSRLRKALDGLSPSEAESDCGPALQLAYSTLTAAGTEGPGAAPAPAAGGRPQGRIYLISDGAGLSLPTDLEDIGDYLTYYTVGTTRDNVGIIGLQFRRPADPSAHGQLFVNVANFTGSERRVLVSLRRRADASPIDAAELALKAGQSSGVTFDREFAPGDYVAALDGGDALALDDRAFLVLDDNRPLRVLLASDGAPVLERFLAAAANVDAVRVEPAKFTEAEETADLYLFDGWVPDQPPRGRTAVYFAPPRAVGPFAPVARLEVARVFDWDRDDPVMRFVSMSDVRLAANTALQLAAKPKLTSLVWTEDATLIGYARMGPVRHYCVAFDVARSTWPRVVSFPIFMGNVLDEARAAQRLGLAVTGKAGTVWQLSQLEPGETVRVDAPGGDSHRFRAEDVTAQFADTDRVGFYAARSAAGVRSFALNLESIVESDIAPQKELRGLGGERVEGESDLASGTQEIWPWAALAAVVLLLVEWYVYHRRIA